MANDLDLRINGTIEKTIASGSGENVLREVDYSGPINTLEFKVTGGSDSDTIKIRGVAVDGNLLVNHSSIGVDMSGNNNNLYDQNFGVDGNTSQVWSKNVMQLEFQVAHHRILLMASKATPGYRSTGSVRYDFDPPITVTQSTDVYYYGSTNAVGVVNFNTNEADFVSVAFNKTGNVDYVNCI